MSYAALDDHVAKERLANGGPVPFKGDRKAFVKRLQLEACVSMKRFFTNKKFHAGGYIPSSYLLSQQHINRVVSTPFVDGIDLCYKLFRQSKIPPPIGYDYDTLGDWDVYFIVHLLGETQKCRIPTYLQAGVMVLYFKVCHGRKLPNIDMDITHLIV